MLAGLVVLAAGCGGYRLRVALEAPEEEAAAAAAPSIERGNEIGETNGDPTTGKPRPAEEAQGVTKTADKAPPAAAGETEAARKETEAQEAQADPVPPTSLELADRRGRHYRNWRKAHQWLTRKLADGLFSASLATEELAYVRQQLLLIRPFLNDEERRLLEGFAAEYDELSARYVPGRGRSTARRLEHLGRRIRRSLGPD